MPKLKEKEALCTLEDKADQVKKAKRLSLFRNPSTYCLGAIGLLFLTYAVSDVAIGLPIRQKIAVTLIILASLYLMVIASPNRSNDSYTRGIYLCMIVCYVYFVISSTLLDTSLGRGDLKSIADPALRREHYERWFVNLVPLHTVKTIYIDALKNGYLSLGYVVFNAIGNLLILAPLSILIPAVSKKLSKPYFLLPILLASTLAIELLQYAFMRGSCDVDDVIFNFVGAVAVWGLAQIPLFKKALQKIMFL